MRKRKWIFSTLAVFAGIVLVIYAIGYFLPERHTVSAARELNLTAEKTWQMLTDFENYPSWRSDINAVKSLSPTTWTEVDMYGDQITYEQVQKIDQRRLITRITTEDLPYSGQWIFDIDANGENCILTIEEQGIVYNPFFRFISKFIIGQTSGIEQYLDDLEKVVP